MLERHSEEREVPLFGLLGLWPRLTSGGRRYTRRETLITLGTHVHVQLPSMAHVHACTCMRTHGRHIHLYTHMKKCSHTHMHPCLHPATVHTHTYAHTCTCHGHAHTFTHVRTHRMYLVTLWCDHALPSLSEHTCLCKHTQAHTAGMSVRTHTCTHTAKHTFTLI